MIKIVLELVSNTVILEVFEGYDQNSRASRSNTTYAHEQGDPHQVFSHRVMEITCAYVEDHLRDGPHSKNASWQCAWKEVEVVVPAIDACV